MGKHTLNSPETESTRAPQTFEVTTQDGYTIHGSYFSATHNGSKTVLINSAVGVKRRYYDSFANFLANKGFSTVTFDYRGIGDSRPRSLKGFRAKMEDWGSHDIPCILEWIARLPETKDIYLVCHSAGGQLIGLTPGIKCVKGMLFVSVQSGYWGYWSGAHRYVMASLWYLLMPLLTKVYGYFPSKTLRLGEELPRDVALQWASWCRDPQYLMSQQSLAEQSWFEAYDKDIIAYGFSDDNYAPLNAVDHLLSFYVNANIEKRYYSPQDAGKTEIGHFGFFKSYCANPFWNHVIEWLEEKGKGTVNREKKQQSPHNEDLRAAENNNNPILRRIIA